MHLGVDGQHDFGLSDSAIAAKTYGTPPIETSQIVPVRRKLHAASEGENQS
jgi:hypothetical protein